ncbi:hypothetical protein BZK28_05470 [Helicobacter pylori]|nr:hypothetical protein BZK28_05470 [Helicobacter pylori]
MKLNPLFVKKSGWFVILSFFFFFFQNNNEQAVCEFVYGIILNFNKKECLVKGCLIKKFG